MAPIEVYQKLSAFFGKQNWWPVTNKGELAPTYKPRAELSEKQKFEIVVGAFLTQNTAWSNVEKALAALKRAKIFSCKKIANANKKRLASLIRSSGYFNQKAGRLKIFCSYLLKNYNCSLKKMFSKPTPELRNELLSLKGIGKETADSILLYAAGRPVFVVDAYTKRLNERLGLSKQNDYDSLQSFFESALQKDARLFNESHALIVRFCKEICRKKPLCTKCFLRKDCYYCKAK